MDAKKCDRCGEYYVPNVFKWSYRVEKNALPISRIDLCHNCMCELETWLKGEKHEK